MKKRIPLDIRRALEAVVANNKGLFKAHWGKDYIVEFKDIDPMSDFFFSIKANTSGTSSYIIAFKPHSDTSVKSTNTTVTAQSFKQYFEKWVRLLKEYNKESPLFDDTITKGYYDDLAPKFEIIDEDADVRTYSNDHQVKIIAFLNKANELLAKHEDDEDAIETIELIEETKKTISKSVKRKVIDNIRKIIAKGCKVSTEVGKKLIIEFTSELAKKLITGEINIMQ